MMFFSSVISPRDANTAQIGFMASSAPVSLKSFSARTSSARIDEQSTLRMIEMSTRLLIVPMLMLKPRIVAWPAWLALLRNGQAMRR